MSFLRQVVYQLQVRVIVGKCSHVTAFMKVSMQQALLQAPPLFTPPILARHGYQVFAPEYFRLARIVRRRL